MKSPNDVVKKISHRQPSTFDHETRCTAQKNCLFTSYLFLKHRMLCDPHIPFVCEYDEGLMCLL